MRIQYRFIETSSLQMFLGVSYQIHGYYNRDIGLIRVANLPPNIVCMGTSLLP